MDGNVDYGDLADAIRKSRQKKEPTKTITLYKKRGVFRMPKIDIQKLANPRNIALVVGAVLVLLLVSVFFTPGAKREYSKADVIQTRVYYPHHPPKKKIYKLETRRFKEGGKIIEVTYFKEINRRQK